MRENCFRNVEETAYWDKRPLVKKLVLIVYMKLLNPAVDLMTPYGTVNNTYR